MKDEKWKWRSEGRTMTDERQATVRKPCRLWIALFILHPSAFILLLAVMPWEKMFPDYITYWTAGRLVACGKSPYDVDAQIQLQRAHGWDRTTKGRGIFEFLPYYYPPWFALFCTVFVPLGFDGGKLAWFGLNLELLLLAGMVLKRASPRLPPSIPVVGVPLFLFSLLALFGGQTSIVVLFLAAVTWRLLNRRWDLGAGAALAFMMTKPQVALVLVLAVLIWATRQRRYQVVQGFALAFGALCLVSTLVIPAWPFEMLSATRRTPPPTEIFPWLGNAWFLILKSAGLRSWGLWSMYAVVAVPFLVAVIKSAFNVTCPPEDVIALGFLAAFFVAPYGRHYDFPVLLIPLFVLLANRLSELRGAVLLLGILLIPYFQFVLLVRFSHLVVPDVDFYLECTYFWVPALLAAVWFNTGSSRTESPPR
jgi:hypothetical protein